MPAYNKSKAYAIYALRKQVRNAQLAAERARRAALAARNAAAKASKDRMMRSWIGNKWR